MNLSPGKDQEEKESPFDFNKASIKDLASIVSNKLIEFGIESILVGGACVSIYSQNRYQSYDLDYIVYEEMKSVEKALFELGFEKEERYFSHKDCPFYIEFVSPPVAIGNESIQKFEKLNAVYGEIHLLTPTDCVKDRLASYYHWDDRQTLEQALFVCKDQTIDLSEVKKWSLKEGYVEKFEQFLNKFKRG